MAGIDDHLDELEAGGLDVSGMREALVDVRALPTGDDTPVPGALMRPAATLPDPTTVLVAPPLHNGLNEPPEGKFYERRASGLILPSESTYPGQRQHIRLTRRVDRVIRSDILHWMCFISLLVVLVLKW